jgi:predicted  nucleic acid-binding Zn-ribbon protein
MTDETLDERCGTCDCQLVRTPADDPANPYNHPAVTCPNCLEVKRVER